jgi:hypothetical protein
MLKFKKGDKYIAHKASFEPTTWTVKAINKRLGIVICTSNSIEFPTRQFSIDELLKLRKV